MGNVAREIKVFSDLRELSEYAARRFAQIARRAVQSHGRFCVCLSGGSTPRQMYSRLAEDPIRNEIPWHAAHVFWGDERCVPPDHSDSSYAMAFDLMLYKVPIPGENIHRMQGESQNPTRAAAEYEEMLKGFFGVKAPQLPRFDLILLGMGADGHTASLFPGTNGLREAQRWVIANYVPKLKANRLTLTLPVLNNAAHIMFLVAGAEKASALHAVLQEDEGRSGLPAGSIRPVSGTALWLIDRAAASRVTLSHTNSLSK